MPSYLGLSHFIKRLDDNVPVRCKDGYSGCGEKRRRHSRNQAPCTGHGSCAATQALCYFD